jgi:hypothetical protein
MQKRLKIEGSGRKQGSQNLLQRELREQLHLHLANELNAIQARVDELPLLERYKVASMLFKLLIPSQMKEFAPPPVIHVHRDL